MKRRLGGLIGDRRGASAVEFAMVIGPLLLLICGVFEFGRVMWTREALQETATAGARCMGMTASSCASGGGYSSTGTITYIEGVAAGWGITLTASDITLASDAACAGVTAANGFSSVTIAYPFQSIAPNVVKALSGTTTLTATACFPNY